MDVPQFFIPSPIEGYIDSSVFLAIMNKAAINMHVQGFM